MLFLRVQLNWLYVSVKKFGEVTIMSLAWQIPKSSQLELNFKQSSKIVEFLNSEANMINCFHALGCSQPYKQNDMLKTILQNKPDSPSNFRNLVFYATEIKR